jgi:dihydroflavonol-4-reductase
VTRALVAGATGMLGRYLVRRLLAAGYDVRALVRPQSVLNGLASLPIEIVQITDPMQKSLRSALTGVHLVFHAAMEFAVTAAFRDRDPLDISQQANLALTDALVGASEAAGVSRFVFVSSTSVYCPDTASPICEDAVLAPTTAYGRAKLAGEARVHAAQERGMPATIVRPCIMYGEGDRHFLPTAYRLIRLPVLPLIAGGRFRYDLIFADDVAALLVRTVQTDSAIGRIYNAGSDAALPLRAIVEVISRAVGHAPPIVALPAWMIRRIAPVARWYLGRFAPGLEDLLSPTGFVYLTQDVYYDMGAAWRDLRYRPRTRFADGLARTLAACSDSVLG